MTANREHDDFENRSSRLPHLFAVLIVCSGITISLFFLYHEHRESQITTQRVFEEQFEKRIQAISNLSKIKLLTVESTGAFFDASSYVGPGEFSGFVSHFLENIKSIHT